MRLGLRRHGAGLVIAFALKKRRRAAALQGALRAQGVETWALLSAAWRLSEQYWSLQTVFTLAATP